MPVRIANAFNASPNGSQAYARCRIQTIGSCSVRHPCHCASRAPWAMAAARASQPAMAPPGCTRSTAATAIISATVTAVMPLHARTAPSTPRCRNAVAVKDGVMRPPMTVTRISAKLTAASSACRESATSPRNRPRWKGRVTQPQHQQHEQQRRIAVPLTQQGPREERRQDWQKCQVCGDYRSEWPRGGAADHHSPEQPQCRQQDERADRRIPAGLSNSAPPSAGTRQSRRR